MFRQLGTRKDNRRRLDGTFAPRQKSQFHCAFLAGIEREAQLRHQGPVSIDQLEIVRFRLIETHLHHEDAGARYVHDAEFVRVFVAILALGTADVDGRFVGLDGGHVGRLGLDEFLLDRVLTPVWGCRTRLYRCRRR